MHPSAQTTPTSTVHTDTRYTSLSMYLITRSRHARATAIAALVEEAWEVRVGPVRPGHAQGLRAWVLVLEGREPLDASLAVGGMGMLKVGAELVVMGVADVVGAAARRFMRIIRCRPNVIKGG